MAVKGIKEESDDSKDDDECRRLVAARPPIVAMLVRFSTSWCENMIWRCIIPRVCDWNMS